jgi:AraC-like DNA-binding protein
MIFLYSHLAKYYFEQGNYLKSKQLAEKAVEVIYAVAGHNHTYDKALKILSEIYAKEGNYRRAYEMLEQWSVVNDSLQAKAGREELSKINSRFTFENHRKEQLAEKQRIAERNRTYFMFSLTFALFVLAGWVFHSRQMNRKNRNLYLQIKEQDYLAEELKRMTELQQPETVPNANEEGVCNTPQHDLVSRLKHHLQTNQNFANLETDSDTLITELATNRTYLFEAVKAVTGKTLQEYINSLRLDEARHILTTTNEPIAMVAELCGYNTPQTFYRQFKERFGISPAEYRRQGKRV